MVKVRNKDIDVEDLSGDELHTLYVFLQGRIRTNVFVSEQSKDQTYADWQEVEYEYNRRLELQKSAEVTLSSTE